MIGECHRRHRAVEFRAFLDTIEAAVPAEIEVHVILDNYRTTAPAASMASPISCSFPSGKW